MRQFSVRSRQAHHLDRAEGTFVEIDSSGRVVAHQIRNDAVYFTLRQLVVWVRGCVRVWLIAFLRLVRSWVEVTSLPFVRSGGLGLAPGSGEADIQPGAAATDRQDWWD